MAEKHCILCGAPLEENALLSCPNMPASAQDIPDAEQVKRDQGVDLELRQCSGCGLVQFDCEPVWYYRDVIRAGGGTSTMAQLRREQYRRFIGLCGLAGKRVIEVGCGQGEFLELLTEFPVQAFGLEHKPELVALAQSKGLNVTEGFAQSGQTRISGGPFDAFLSFNFLEHQPDPNGMMQCISQNLVPGGYGLVTVPSFEYILENNGFYELLRDHIANYTQDTLRFLMEKNGFQVLQTRRVNRDTLEMIVRKRLLTDTSGLEQNFRLLAEQMRSFVDARVARGGRVAIWGASHQGFTAAATTGVADRIAYIIDSAPFKQGRFAPASHLPIVAPEHFLEDPVNSILVIAPGYTEEIRDVIRERFGPQVEIAALRSAQVEILEEGSLC